ncbi:hypothetical protein PCE1_000406 [Barthelona sp. PCE]
MRRKREVVCTDVKNAPGFISLSPPLNFSCHFDSGNLDTVTRVNNNEYSLTIRPDTGNRRQKLWFYFQVFGAERNQTVLFHVKGFCKTRSLYRHGMSPVVRSSTYLEWRRLPAPYVFYYHYNDENTMSFLFKFADPADSYFFAYTFPFSYTQLQRSLFHIEQQDYPFVTRTLLCRTVFNRRVDLIRIDNFCKAFQPPVFVFSARVHPGETPSSFIMHGLLKFLLSNHPRAQYIRNNSIVFLVPMLNPDGVFLGNYRSDSYGQDLNRCWNDASETLCPTISAMKKFLLELDNDPGLSLRLFVDIHAHSTVFNSFVYGNSTGSRPSEYALMFPRLLSRYALDFSSANSKYVNDANKMGTGRYVMGQELQSNCYTLEVSFFGMREANRIEPYTPATYQRLGTSVGMALADLVEF